MGTLTRNGLRKPLFLTSVISFLITVQIIVKLIIIDLTNNYY